MSLLDGLLHYWDLSTTAWVDSHGSWTLTARKNTGGGDPAINATGGPDGGACLALDGKNYLDRTNVAWDGSGAARSVSVWGNYTALNTGANFLVMHRGDVAGTKTLHQTAISSATPNLCRGSFADGTTLRTAGTQLATSGAWYHLVATTNGTNRHTLYVNGVSAVSTDALDGNVPTGDIPFAIGIASYQKTATETGWKGSICMAGVWGRELIATEASRLYNAGAGLRYADLGSSGLPLIVSAHYARRMFPFGV